MSKALFSSGDPHALAPNIPGSRLPARERLALSVSEAAEEVRISRRQIYEELQAGRLRTVKVGRRRLVRREDLKLWLDSRPAG